MKKAVTITLLLALALAVAGWVAYNHRPTQRTPQAQSTNAPAEQKSSTPAQAELGDIEKALNSADGKTQLGALTASMRTAYEAAGQDKFLPKGATLNIEPGTFKANGDYANVNATMSAPDVPTTNMVLMLIREDATQPWKLLDFKQK